MSEPTTLGELLQDLTRRQDEPPASCTFEKGYNDGLRVAGFALRRIVYSTDEPCPVCDGTGYDPPDHPCLFCHGTSRDRTPGLVERPKRQVLDAATAGGGPEMPNTSAALVYGAGLAFEALEREIGEITP
jgi:hypothetical protein